MFDIHNKIALITGGASGIGFFVAKELLKNGLKGCTILDINQGLGKDAVKTINAEFGKDKAIFIEGDVANKIQFDAAFKATIQNFNNLDIVINNAGILNDAEWEQTIQVNIQGVIHGILLGMETYLQHYASSGGGVILNMASICGLDAVCGFPIYTCSKFAIVGLTKSFGADQHFQRTHVKVVALCPGVTDTKLTTASASHFLSQEYSNITKIEVTGTLYQTPEIVAQAAVQVIKEGKTGSVWVIENEGPLYEVNFPSRQERRVC